MPRPSAAHSGAHWRPASPPTDGQTAPLPPASLGGQGGEDVVRFDEMRLAALDRGLYPGVALAPSAVEAAQPS